MMISTVRGEFERFSGNVVFDEGDISRSYAELQIEAASVYTQYAA